VSSDTFVFFLASTFGNGGPPTDAEKFAGEMEDQVDEGDGCFLKGLK